MDDTQHTLAIHPDRVRIGQALAALSVHLRPSWATGPDTPERRRTIQIIVDDFINDLMPYGADTVVDACNRWRTHGRPFFPKVSDLVRFIEKANGKAKTTRHTPVMPPRIDNRHRDALEPVRNALAPLIGQAAVQSWFHDAGLKAHDRSLTEIILPTRFTRDYVQSNYLSAVLTAVNRACGPTEALKFTYLAEVHGKHPEVSPNS